MLKKRIYYLVLFILICSQVSFANNISLSNVSLTTKNTSAGVDNAANFRSVQFDISWDNSWRTSSAPNNWDAAWVFMKYRLNGTGDWKHANFNAGAGQTAPTGGVIDVPADGVGAFIYRSANGSGTFSLNAAQLRWNYRLNNVLDNDVVEIKLFAIEMVYVPQGSFYLGSGGTETGTFTNGSVTLATASPVITAGQITSINVTYGGSNYNTPPSIFFNNTGGGSGATASANLTSGVLTSITINSPGNNYTTTTKIDISQPPSIPFQITSEVAININNTSGNLWALGSIYSNSSGSSSSIESSTTLPAAFPKGYKGFYCMKYEISQSQYRDFLNTLNYNQQQFNMIMVPSSVSGTGILKSTSPKNRNGLVIGTSGVFNTLTPAEIACDLDGDRIFNEEEDGEWLPCNFLTWNYGSSYLDWSGLRPMTEFEFEKLSRGTATPLSNEFPWGTITGPFLVTTGYTLNNAGKSNETISNYSTTRANVNYLNTSYYSPSNPNQGLTGPMRVGITANANSNRTNSAATYYGIMDIAGSLTEPVINVVASEGRNYDGQHGDGELINNTTTSAGRANVTNWPTLQSGKILGTGIKGGGWQSQDIELHTSYRRSATTSQSSTSSLSGFRGVRTGL